MRKFTPIPFRPDWKIAVQPYQEAAFPPIVLVHLWHQMQEDKLSVWMDGGMDLTLNQFIRFFDPERGRLLLLPIVQQEGQSFQCADILGCFWLNRVTITHKADAHFFFFKRYWGAWPLVALRACVTTVFAPPLSLELLWCEMAAHNQFGKQLMQRLGVHMLGEVTRWFKTTTGQQDAIVGALYASDWKQRSANHGAQE